MVVRDPEFHSPKGRVAPEYLIPVMVPVTRVLQLVDMPVWSFVSITISLFLSKEI